MNFLASLQPALSAHGSGLGSLFLDPLKANASSMLNTANISHSFHEIHIPCSSAQPHLQTGYCAVQ
jgi:hypothetical protein